MYKIIGFFLSACYYCFSGGLDVADGRTGFATISFICALVLFLFGAGMLNYQFNCKNELITALKGQRNVPASTSV